MAKVAFDVQGTLKGYNSAKVVQLFKFLEARGHELTIWSWGGVGMAMDAKQELGLRAGCSKKFGPSYDTKDLKTPTFDVCVDDEPQDAARLLDARKVIDVATIPEKLEYLENFCLKYSL